MGFEDELHRLKEDYNNRYNNAGEIRKAMLSEEAKRVSLAFRSKCIDEAKKGHSFFDMMQGYIPIRKEDVDNASKLIRDNVLFAIENNIQSFTGKRNDLVTPFVLPKEKAFFTAELRKSLDDLDMENAVIKVVTVYRPKTTSKEVGFLIRKTQSITRQIIDHDAFRISMSW